MAFRCDSTTRSELAHETFYFHRKCKFLGLYLFYHNSSRKAPLSVRSPGAGIIKSFTAELEQNTATSLVLVSTN